MTARHSERDQPFFAQWNERGSLARTLDCAEALLDLLAPRLPPSLAVIGSKGKGSAATGATYALAGSGLTVVTITSPAHVTNRERIRINGRAIDDNTYAELGHTLGSLLPRLPAGHYLSPSGAYTVMGLDLASRLGADVVVLEEGMGGRTDEISLVDHRALALTEVFVEHRGILGDDTFQIAENLLGAGGPSVQLLAAARQAPAVDELASRRAREWGASIVPHSPLPHRNRLIGAALGLGFHLGAALAGELGGRPVAPRALELPGRSSVHEHDGRRWFVDGAISPDGVREALAACPFTPDTILGAWPADKDWSACLQASAATPVRAGEHLTYPGEMPHWREVELRGNVAAIGTQSFVGEILDFLGADTRDMWWTA